MASNIKKYYSSAKDDKSFVLCVSCYNDIKTGQKMKLMTKIKEKCPSDLFTDYMNYITTIIEVACINDPLAQDSWEISKDSKYFIFNQYDVGHDLKFKYSKILELYVSNKTIGAGYFHLVHKAT